MLPRGVILGLRASIVVFSLGATAGCRPKPGQLPVDSPIYAYRAPETDDDDDSDSTTNDGSESGSGAASGSAMQPKE